MKKLLQLLVFFLGSVAVTVSILSLFIWLVQDTLFEHTVLFPITLAMITFALSGVATYFGRNLLSP